MDAIQRELCHDGFVLRYDTADGDDGLPPGEGAFLPCTFWLVDALALLGRRDEAQALFDRVASLRNDVGLLSRGVRPGRAAGSSATSRRRSATSGWSTARSTSSTGRSRRRRASARGAETWGPGAASPPRPHSAQAPMTSCHHAALGVVRRAR